MKLVFIIGPSAVGKMTVGRELSKITELDLLHNHQTIDLTVETTGDYDFGLISELRESVVRYYASNNRPGLILTFRHNFIADGSYIHLLSLLNEASINTFDDYGTGEKTEIYVVELSAKLKTRIERNKNTDRLMYKRTKENIEVSEKELLDAEECGVYNTKSLKELKEKLSFLYEVPDKNVKYIKIDTEKITAEEAALKIKKRFKLEDR